MLYVRPSVPEDVTRCAPLLRPADKAELSALGYSPHDALQAGLTSAPCLTIMDTVGDQPVAMFGAAPTDVPGVASIWLLGTDAMVTKGNRLQFLRECRAWVDTLNRIYPALYNMVDARNEVHLKWISWCGFKFIGHGPEGPEALPFIHFMRSS